MAIRVGLAGYGFGGRSFHAPLIASAAGVELVGVVTRSPDRRAELERDHPGTPAFDSLAELDHMAGRSGRVGWVDTRA